MTTRNIVAAAAPAADPPPTADPIADPLGLYAALGVRHDAPHEDICRAFRRLSSRWHPDRAGGDGARYARITAAFDVIGDPVKRARYDETGAEPVDAAKMRAAAMEAVNAIVMNFIDIVDDPTQQSLLKFLVFNLNEARKKAEQSAKGMRRSLEKSKVVAARLKAPKAHMVRAAINQKIANTKRAIAMIEQQLACIEVSRTIVDGIGYHVDEPRASSSGGINQYIFDIMVRQS